MPTRLSLAFALSATLAGAAAAQDAALAGRIDGDMYVSATGEFKIRMPVLTELGGKVEDTDNVVTFSDNFNTHISIACFALDATQKWELETRGLRDYLLFFVTDALMPDFERRFPGSKVESARFLPELQDGSLIAYALLPGGSFFEARNKVLDGPALPPVVAKRGSLLFVRNHYVYVLSTELAERATQRSTYSQTAEAEDTTLSNRLVELAGRLVFLSAKTRGS